MLCNHVKCDVCDHSSIVTQAAHVTCGWQGVTTLLNVVVEWKGFCPPCQTKWRYLTLPLRRILSLTLIEWMVFHCLLTYSCITFFRFSMPGFFRLVFYVWFYLSGFQYMVFYVWFSIPSFLFLVFYVRFPIPQEIGWWQIMLPFSLFHKTYIILDIFTESAHWADSV